MERQDAVDQRVRMLVEVQHGAIARRQLLGLGFSRERVRSWLVNGRLVSRHRGVYTLGHGLLSREGMWMAAVLACREPAALSHRSAAAHWGLRPRHGGPTDVTVPADGSRCPRGGAIRPHRSSVVFPEFVTVLEGVPVTTVAWTLVDLAALVAAHHLRRAVERADQLELFDLSRVERALTADPGRPGSPALAALLRDMRAHGVTMTRSDVEAALLHICLDHGLARPLVNASRDGSEVDFRWPDHGLIVEVDGWAFHRSRRAFTDDRVRDRRALREGLRVARFTAAEIERAPARVAAELRALLRGSAAR